MKKLFVANRGEIAVRIIRAARDLGIKTAIGYSDCDSGTLPVRLADEKVSLGGNTATDTYLNIDKLLNAARLVSADAVHPGYGFLAENAPFARACGEAGLLFVGPKPDVVELMGDKANARRVARESGVPLLPGSADPVDVAGVESFVDQYGLPVVLKAVAGGSGRGMRIIRDRAQIQALWEDASEEALRSFRNGALFVERFLEQPRHIEVQVFGDTHGTVVVVGERECSVQRRHQKLIEECPAPNLHPELRAKLHAAAHQLTQKVSYTNSGTIEFLVEGGTSSSDPFYFLEMNTRIQVEHPVTEEAFGVDLVRLQLAVAMGERLPAIPTMPERHAIEFRIYAEDPTKEFSPMTGQVHYLSPVSGIGIREDGWAESGTKISPYYDSLLTKIIAIGPSREEALKRAKRCLAEFHVDGLPTTADFHRWILNQPDFCSGNWDVYQISRTYKGQIETSRFVGPLEVHPYVAR